MLTMTALSANYNRLIRSLLGCLASCAIASCAIASCDFTDVQKIEKVVGLLGQELPEKTLSLTFDDGPGARTEEIAHFLWQRQIPATFFINGSNVPIFTNQPYTDPIKAIIAGGHVLANHTQNHVCLLTTDAATIIKEITDTDNLIVAAQSNGPFYFRAPWGAYTLDTLSVIHASPTMKKYAAILSWDMGGQLISNVSAQDNACWANGYTPAQCGDLYLTEIRNAKHGGIILVHDSHDQTIDMLKLIIPTLQNEGYKFVSLAHVPSVQRALLVQPQVIHEFTAPNPAGDGPRYLYSASATASPGWSASTPVPFAFLGDLTAAAGSIPVYSYHAVVPGIGWKQMLSTDPAVGKGWTRDAILFYAFQTAGFGRAPLYSFYRVNSPGWNFRYSLSSTAHSGESSFGIVAYVPAN